MSAAVESAPHENRHWLQAAVLVLVYVTIFYLLVTRLRGGGQ